MNKLVLHIPHSTTKIKRKFWKNIIIDKNIVLRFINDICDYKTDYIFGSNRYPKIRAKYSRVYCDVEKFAEDEKEIMSQFGQGMIYTKTNFGQTFIKYNEDYKNKIYKNYYLKYHNKLNKIVEREIKNNTVILIDCHSFDKDIIMFEDKKNNLPDICIGHNQNYNKKLINYCYNYFIDLGYNTVLNYPYEGTIIPNAYFEKQPKNLHSVMIELNKKIYYDDIEKFKIIINDLLKNLEKLELYN